MNNSYSAPASSPLPWHVGLNPGPIVYGPKGEIVADLSANILFSKERKANALFICKACNGHAELVAALTACEAKLSAVCRAFYVDGKPSAIAAAAMNWVDVATPARAALKTHA